jgi:replicative DNA helicase
MTDEIACPEAEAALLSCLLRGRRITVGMLARQVNAEDFTDPRHRLVLAGIKHTLEAGVTPDPVSVLGTLRRLALLPSFLDDKSAGPLLAELYAAAPVPESAWHYLRVVLEHRFRRRVAEAGGRLLDQAGRADVESLARTVAEEWVALSAQRSRMQARSGTHEPDLGESDDEDEAA